MMTEQRPAPVEGVAPLTLAQTRANLAAEWVDRSPRTGADIADFYVSSEALAPDLDAWHDTPERQSWTDMLVHVARESRATCAVDIGCGAGHDLAALRDAEAETPTFPGLGLCGIEPNRALRDRIRADWWAAGHLPPDLFRDVESAPVESADLLVCVDVLEHLTDPEAFLTAIASRAPVGCLLFEATATHDATTPLHLAENRGWHPGRALESQGWRIVDEAQRVRVWKRLGETGIQSASLLLCAYRGVTADSMQSIMATTGLAGGHWRLRIKAGDALIGRSRNIITTSWWRETNDDVALMVDDDVTFSPADADHITELCRNGYDVICGAYPVHNGQHLAMRCLPGTGVLDFGPGHPPVEIQYAATGFVAFSRRVIDALVKDLPLCHPTESWSFYNLFPQMVVEEPDGTHILLSEDYGFSHLAREAGFRVWLDPTARLKHGSTVPTSVTNMGRVYDAIQQA